MCHRGQVLKKEMTLAGNTDITVAITEPLTGKKEVTVPVKVKWLECALSVGGCILLTALAYL